MLKNAFAIILAVIVIGLGTGIAVGQEITGSIVGTVRDANGAAIAGATVTATIPDQGNRQLRRVVTNSDGTFSMPNVPVSVYAVTVEASNFKKFVQTDVRVEVGQRRSVDVMLEAGSISETVTVEGGGLTIESSIPQNSTTVSSTQVTELSINNRNWVQFIALAPGVSSNLADLVPVGNFSPDGSPNIMSISVNGARQSQNTYTVDGADITDRGANITIQASPSLDSIGELKILRSLYPAESGRSGGGQINVVTKSGTDKFHGSLFEFVRNEKLNANSFVINRSRSAGVDANGKAIKPPFRYNNYGFTFSGPIYFLNFGENDGGFFRRYKKTYFFFSEEQRKDRRYSTLTGNAPTADMRRGIFTNPICLSASQTTGNVRTCNQILPAGTPLSAMVPYNPASAQYLQYVYSQMPVPVSGTALTSLGNAAFDFQQEILKIDTSITDKLSGYYRYQRDKVPTRNPNSVNNTPCNIAGVCPIVTDAPGRTHTAQATYVFSPNLILEGRFTRAFGGIFTTPEGSLAAKNSPIEVAKPYAVADPRIPFHTGFTTLSNVQGYGAWNNFSTKMEWGGNVTWIANGKHTMKFGGNYSRYRKNEDQLGGTPQGSFSSFANTVSSSPVRATVCVNATNQAIACPTGFQTTEQQFANFLMGFNTVFTQTKYNLTADFRQRNFEWYAQDEFRMNRRVTIYAGVRYSFYGPPWDKNGLLSNFVPELWTAASAPQVTFTGTTSNRVSGSGNFCNGLIVNAQNYQTGPSTYQCTPTVSPYGKYVYESRKNNYAPRFGIAWDISGKGQTVVRTGYGMYYDQVLVGNVELHLGNPPYQETVSLTGGSLSQPLPPGQTPVVTASLAVPAIIRGVPTDYKNPYMQHWSLDVQHLFSKKTMLTLGYYGSKGTHLIGIVDINNLPPGFALTKTCQLNTTTTGPCQGVDANGVPISFTASVGQGHLDQIRPYRGYRSIAMVKPDFSSNYHSLQVQATQRFTGASQIQFAYTWSKNLTNNQTDRSTAPQNSYNYAAEYGRAQLDRRHVINVNYIYEIPYRQDQKGFAGKVLGGWQVSGIAVHQTGLPFTPTVGGGTWDPAGLGYFGSSPAGGRPNIICDPNKGGKRTFEEWFNYACFAPISATGPAVPGNAGRGVIEGPPTTRFDVTMTKNLRFGERYKLQLKAEAFNVFNHTNITTLSLVVTTPHTVGTNGLHSGFGSATGTRDPRTIQLGARFIF